MLLLHGLQVNTTLHYVSIKLDRIYIYIYIYDIDQNYLAGPDSIVFDDKEETLNSSFESMLKNNNSIETLELINLRLKGETIDYIAKGIKWNTTLVSLNMQGSLMVYIYIYIYISHET